MRSFWGVVDSEDSDEVFFVNSRRSRSLSVVAAALALLATALWSQSRSGSRFVVRFANGDVLHVRPVSLQNGNLTFVPDVAPNAPVTVPAAKIDSIACDGCPDDTAKTEDVLRLRDGSVLKGSFVRLSAEALSFSVAGLGEVAIPRSAANALLRGGAEGSPPRAPGATHLVATKAGDILIGAVQPGTGATLIVEGRELRATLNYSSVKAIYFPAAEAVESKTEGTKGSREGLRMTVTLRNGTKLLGSSPTLSGSEFSMVIAGNHRVKVSSDALRELAFAGTGSQASLKRVLVWGRYADRHQEFKRTVEVLQTGLAGWTLDEDFGDDFTPEFRKKLFQSRTLVIPEMERWQSPRFRKGAVANPAGLAANLKSVTGPFLRAGGNVVILCPSRYQTDFLREAGLLDVAATKNYDNQEVTFTPEGASIARGIGRGFRTTNATQFYTVGTRLPAAAWAVHGTETPLVGRKVGGGWVILLGMDFFARNDQTAKLLVNAVTFQ